MILIFKLTFGLRLKS